METMKAVSRTAWESFIRCKRCFYLERKLKIRPIGMPGYPINSRVDALLKTEFDFYRKKQECSCVCRTRIKFLERRK